MDAGCGSSTPGHRDGPVTCNKSHRIHHAMPHHRRWVPCDGSVWTRHIAMFGPCYRLLWLSSDDSTWFTRLCIGRILGSAASRSCCCRGSKMVLNACFLGISAKTEVHRPPGFCNVFAVMAASDVYECIPAIKPSTCSHIPLLCAGVIKNYYCYYINYSYN